MKRWLPLLVALPLFAQGTAPWQTLLNGQPSAILISTTSPTTLVTAASYVNVDQINVYNNSGSTVNVQFFDKSTNCSSGPCPFSPNYPVLAYTKYTISENGQPSIGGLSITVGTANVIYVWAKGRQ